VKMIQLPPMIAMAALKRDIKLVGEALNGKGVIEFVALVIAEHWARSQTHLLTAAFSDLWTSLPCCGPPRLN
jgi:hypothetical protein